MAALAGTRQQKHESSNFFFLSLYIPLVGRPLQACRVGPLNVSGTTVGPAPRPHPRCSKSVESNLGPGAR